MFGTSLKISTQMRSVCFYLIMFLIWIDFNFNFFFVFFSVVFMRNNMVGTIIIISLIIWIPCSCLVHRMDIKRKAERDKEAEFLSSDQFSYDKNRIEVSFKHTRGRLAKLGGLVPAPHNFMYSWQRFSMYYHRKKNYFEFQKNRVKLKCTNLEFS